MLARVKIVDILEDVEITNSGGDTNLGLKHTAELGDPALAVLVIRSRVAQECLINFRHTGSCISPFHPRSASVRATMQPCGSKSDAARSFSNSVTP